MKRILYGLISMFLLAATAFFAYIVVYIASADVVPALAKGSFNVETNSRILNILWEGNEIYLILTAYILLGAACAYGAMRLLRKAIPR